MKKQQEVKGKVAGRVLCQLEGGKAVLKEDILVGNRIIKRTTPMDDPFEKIARSMDLGISDEDISNVGAIAIGGDKLTMVESLKYSRAMANKALAVLRKKE